MREHPNHPQEAAKDEKITCSCRTASILTAISVATRESTENLEIKCIDGGDVFGVGELRESEEVEMRGDFGEGGETASIRLPSVEGEEITGGFRGGLPRVITADGLRHLSPEKPPETSQSAN